MELFKLGLHKEHENVNVANIDKYRLKAGNLLIFACFFLYSASMAVKGVFAAELKYIVGIWSLEYAKVSMANTFYFIAYGLVQVLIFIFSKKLDLKKVIFFTVPFAAVCAVLMGFSTNVMQMWLFFGLTGAFQASIFCGCNHVLTQNLPTKLLSKANRFMNIGYAVGTVIAYGVCGLCITYDLWQIPYFVLGGVFLISVIIFIIVVNNSTRYKHINDIADKNAVVSVNENGEEFIKINSKKQTAIFYAIELPMSFLITALYYGVMNYITSMLVDVHGLSDQVSIYVSIIAPITIALGPMLTIYSCDKNRNFIRQAICYLLIALPFPLFLALFYKVNVVLTLVLSVIFVIIANGVKAIVLSVVAYKMRKQINVGAYTAISNAIASLSAGIVPTIIGSIIDKAGWAVSYYVIFGLTAFIIVALIGINIFAKRMNKPTKKID